ncbi:hypothetical protein U14_01107 [Candidatus Moduliflexus flocculans]|uniref:DUF4038 domain-containing protein n=1 Tax=Candidatus Moduliflexus flocculans TaxID=1499966 RepID=A0A0S6VRF3_9BACT|nr:hypothetical protein U14_01107 [Candidatus Moduliflexus flocculans]
MMLNRFRNHRGRLRVAADHRHLEFEDGTPFLYLGDTAWELFHRLNREETQYYLNNRAAKGFTVIQAVVLAELDGINIPNSSGDLPLINHDPTTPNEAYFRHVDAVVRDAEELGLFIGMLPSWGSGWKQEAGNDSFIFTVENARIYGRFLGERYRDHSVIWILGGDRNIEHEEEYAIIESMALGLKEGDRGAHLITFHPRGPGRSAAFLHHAEWLDFNMCQTSHGARDHDNGLFIAQDYALEPPKPTVDGEPRYETMPVGFYYKDVNRYDRFDDDDMRQAAYWAMLAGACGHTYGHNCVWQMWTPDRESRLWAATPWREALDHPGAFQMGLLRRLFQSRPFQKLLPDQTMIVDGPVSGGAKIRAARAADGTFAVVYSPRGEQFTLNKGAIQAQRIKEFWYDPRYGSLYHFHSTDNAGFQTYAPPTSGRGNDWVLILEDVRLNFPIP